MIVRVTGKCFHKAKKQTPTPIKRGNAINRVNIPPNPIPFYVHLEDT